MVAFQTQGSKPHKVLYQHLHVDESLDVGFFEDKVEVVDVDLDEDLNVEIDLEDGVDVKEDVDVDLEVDVDGNVDVEVDEDVDVDVDGDMDVIIVLNSSPFVG